MNFKFLTLEELIINLDRLSRFKDPDESYKRVFYEIITKSLIFPKYSKKELENEKPEIIVKIIEKIWNSSVKQISTKSSKDGYKLLKFLVKNTFKNLNDDTEKYISAKLNINPILETLDYDRSPLNLKFLIIASNLTSINKNELTKIRINNNLKFPVEKLLIVEGITEEILLPIFADKLNHNFDKNGIFILGAGGKSKSPALYTKLKNKLKIPVVFLFDSDAKDIHENLKTILLKKDKSILIEQGEFEDILPINLIKRSLNNEYEPATLLSNADLKINKKMCDNIELFYKTRHLGEFKKSKVSKIISKNIKYKTDITKEIEDIILRII